MALEIDNHNRALLQHLVAEVVASPGQRLTFARFMELALYEPTHGYYATRAHQIGVSGDFFTSPHLGADFGELLAEQFQQLWQILGCPRPFQLVEMGAGQGIIAADILSYLQRQHPDFFAALNYIIVEKVAALIQLQQQQLQTWAAQVQWRDWSEIPNGSITGCCFSNELVDAFPVHRLVLQDGRWQEVYLESGVENSGAANGFPLQAVLATPSTPAIDDYLQHAGLEPAQYPQGYTTEVNLAARDWLSTVATRLQRGYLLTIDYGYPARQYYSPARTQGTLQCYYQHAANSDPYSNVGHQDITAHVDFSALEQWGEAVGLKTLGLTQQGPFLMALGLGDRLSANNSGQLSQDLNTVIRRREALHQLMNPLGLGGFRVLLQGKGLSEQEAARQLPGWEFDPFV